MTEPPGLWLKILKSRDGNVENSRDGNVENSVLEKKQCKRKEVSTWWKDLLKLGATQTRGAFNFAESVIFEVGNGLNTPFWQGNWISNWPLAESFSDLFQASKKKGATVMDVGN